MPNYRVTTSLRTHYGVYAEGTIIRQSDVDKWPEDALVSRLRLKDIVPTSEEPTPEFDDSIELPETDGDDGDDLVDEGDTEDGGNAGTDPDEKPTAEELATLTKAEIMKLAHLRWGVTLIEGNKDSLIAQVLAL